jgi:hypothetical protein
MKPDTRSSKLDLSRRSCEAAKLDPPPIRSIAEGRRRKGEKEKRGKGEGGKRRRGAEGKRGRGEKEQRGRGDLPPTP